MTIRVELNPEMERQLAGEALARGIAAGVVCAEAPSGAIGSRAKACTRKPGRIRAFLDALLAKAPNVLNCNRNLLARNDLCEHD